MKFTLKPLILGLALAGVAPIAFAQDNTQPAPPPSDSGQSGAQGQKPKGRMSPQARVAFLKEKLSLTDDQAAKILDISKDALAQMKEIREDDSLSDEDKRAKAMDLMKSINTQIRALLTPDQLKIYDTLPKPGMRRPKPQADSSGSDSSQPPAPPPAPPPSN